MSDFKPDVNETSSHDNVLSVIVYIFDLRESQRFSEKPIEKNRIEITNISIDLRDFLKRT